MARILVVEDDSSVRELLCLQLELAEHDVRRASDGEAGLAAALADPPDLILSDVRMPNRDGFAMLEALRASRATMAVPVVFLSAADDRDSFRRGMDLGADDFLVKPIGPESLLHAVANRLARAQALRDSAVMAGAGLTCAVPTSVVSRPSTTVVPATPMPFSAYSRTRDALSGFEPIAGYDIERCLGVGGMSRVVLARHRKSGSAHVLKIVPIDDGDPDTLQRFIQEYALIAQLRHRYIARIFSQGFGASSAYIAMEYLAHGDLRARIDAGMTEAECLRWAEQAAAALTVLHSHGIVHRDLKPENLMFRDGETLVLADFGIAKQLTTQLTRTRHGEVLGTPFYMSPEQARGVSVDSRSDLYSFGAILFEMLTGTKPFTAQHATALAYQHIHADIPTLPHRFSAWQPLIAKSLAKRPDERWNSAFELLEALRRIRKMVANDRATVVSATTFDEAFA